MLTDELLAFARSSLPAPPARVLEIGAGDGSLADALGAAGYEVVAIDPAAEPGGPVQPIALLEASGRFDAAIAVVSLHHVEPLEDSCRHLAALVKPNGVLVIDEIDSQTFDKAAAAWWLGQRRALGLFDDAQPDEMVDDLRHHVHPVSRIMNALGPHFALGAPVRGPYLHRWNLRASLLESEVDLIASGLIPAVGWRQVGVRVDSSRLSV